MSRWLVAGGNGMLGQDLTSVLVQAGHEVASLGRDELDIVDAPACLAAAQGFDVVVNAAAWTDVDGAETQEAAAFEVNAVGAANLARAAQAAAAVLVQVSTDYVFSGAATEAYPVDAPLAPRNAYGRTKAAGEWAARAECRHSYLVRTAWLYGEHGSCFPTTMLRLAAERDTIEVVDDQRGQPTWTRDLATFVHDLVEKGMPFGIHHGTASGETTWFGFAREVLRLAGLDPERVRPTSSDRFRRPAARPTYSVLANDQRLPNWRDGLVRAIPRLLGP